MKRSTTSPPPILAHKAYRQASVFTPENLLREARRQKGAAAAAVPAICLLDPDGDVVRSLRASGQARRHDGWVCYHTELWVFDIDDREVGVVGCAVGAAFAVLVAEELFASGCELLISITSAGEITPAGPSPYFILIERALRDEGVSYHYLPPSDWSDAPATLLTALREMTLHAATLVHGSTWTTDAPFRETGEAIAAAKTHGALAVEMEAAGLYAFARARHQDVICFAYVTNQMGQIEGDFEKGESNGAINAIDLVRQVITSLS